MIRAPEVVPPDAVMLRQMGQAKRFNRWMGETVRPFIGNNVLEIGAGLGNMTELLAVPGKRLSGHRYKSSAFA